MKALLLAAGLGTRLKPWTDHHPKALAVVNNKSLLQHNVEYLVAYGIKDIIVNVHHFAPQILNAIEKSNGWNARIVISDESNEILETGGALMKVQPLLAGEENFLMMNADILTDINITDFIDTHLHQQNLATLAVSSRDTSRYFLFDENEKLCGWKNTQTGVVKMIRKCTNSSPKAFSGMHIINNSIFSLMNYTGKFSITDAYLDLGQRYSIGNFDHTGARFIDVGKPGSVVEAGNLFK